MLGDQLGSERICRYPRLSDRRYFKHLFPGVQSSSCMEACRCSTSTKVPMVCDFIKGLRQISLTSTLSKAAEGIVIEKELKPTILSSILTLVNSVSFQDLQLPLLLYRRSTTGCALWTGMAQPLELLSLTRKAFNLVCSSNHLLIAKLFSLWVKPTTVNWIIDFLRDRQQRVRLNNICYSSWLHIPAGVPRGTSLAPWLILVMINDLQLEGESFSMWKFADDTTVSEVVPISAESLLQEAVNHISRWSHNNLFEVNPTKCKGS